MNMIQLEQTKNHYLLSIPQALMMRAKKIKPRQWDPRGLVWKYPRNKDTYELLINEFENDVEKVSITPPRKAQEFDSEKLVKQNKRISELEHQLQERLHENAQLSIQLDSLQETHQALKAELAEQSQRAVHLKEANVELRLTVDNSEQQCSSLKEALDSKEASVAGLQQQIVDLQQEKAHCQGQLEQLQKTLEK